MNRLVQEHFDTTKPDPPLRVMPSIRVSHILAHPRTDPYRSGSEEVAGDFGIPREAVLAAWSYYLRNRWEINTAIEARNDAYQEELGDA